MSSALTRRDFLATGATAAAALALPSWASAAQAPSTKMFISLNGTVSPRVGPWPEAARLAARIGYGGIAYGKGIKHLRVKKDAKSPAIEPSMENVLEGKYPISRYLYWYLAGSPQGDTLKLCQWVVSDDGQNVVENVGYYPLNKKDRMASAAKLGCLQDGTSVTIAEGPTSAGGHTWYRIEPTGSLKQSGWVVGQHLD